MWPFRKKRAEVQQKRMLLPVSLWRPRGDHSLEGSEAIFGAVSVLSNTLASMRVRLMRDAQEQGDDALARLVGYQPNPRMDAFTFWQTMEACRSTAGNCYAFKVPGANGTVEALDILDPARVEPVRDLDTGDVWYRVTPQDGGEWYIPGREMIHCRHVGTGGDKGVSPMMVLTDTLDYDAQMKTFSLEQVKGVNGAVVLTFPSDMGETRKQREIDSFMANYRRSSGNLIVLSGGVTSSVINKSPVDAKVLDVDRITANKVARVYSLPPTLLGDYSQTRYASQEQQQQEFLTRTVLPMVRMYEAQLDLKLLTWKQRQDGYRFRFDMTDLVVGDMKSRAEFYQVLVRGGMATPNEVRRREGWPPMPGGDGLLVSRDLVPIAQAGKEPMV